MEGVHKLPVGAWVPFGIDSRSFVSSNTKLLLELEIMFGIIRRHTYCSAFNHLLILGKHCLHVNALNNITYQFDDFDSLLREKNKIEKYIAVTCNEEKDFRNK